MVLELNGIKQTTKDVGRGQYGCPRRKGAQRDAEGGVACGGVDYS